ncbi:hypothetical protein CWB41_05965 [Methylovirgula ligni]|uniref:Uncharacterized protein n=1 Tax=Methylovirgula ligni TaxID=569860 RepID=A0A3D9Z2F5_9HYPH|nr:hypothetical protein [Methylovirgula ligni]QAY95337.1 hypothetical protein CWB41_05965 [Methylovirgula ligni]REF89354.1 hypothetical protein DES32_0575 [Methylovirgula ligni]
MTEKPESNSANRESIDQKIETDGGAIPEGSAPKTSDAKSAANAPNGNAGKQRRETLRFLGRLTVNEWLTLLVGIGSLAISYLTYRNAADTSQLTEAVSNLHNLAGSAQGQLNEMKIERRPWVSVDAEPSGKFSITAKAADLPLTLSIKNSGTSPAMVIFRDAYIFPMNSTEADKKLVDSKKCRASHDSGFTSAVFPGSKLEQGVDADLIDGINASELTKSDLFRGFIVVCIRYQEIGVKDTPTFFTEPTYILIQGKGAKPINGHLGDAILVQTFTDAN